MEISLPSGRRIGDGHPCFVIAEVGSNWAIFEDCITSINLAKSCGADAVKFQLFNPIALYGDVPATWDMPIKVNGEAPYMPPDWIPKLATHAKAMGIEFMCSAFSPELLDVVNPYVNIHKVASAECTHVRMLEKLREYGKPVILSTGGHGGGDICRALEILQGAPTVLMYCVSAYPALEVNLDALPLLRSTFGCCVGYSDHSLDVLEIPKRAVSLGACVVEKHVRAVDVDSPDSPHSLTIDQFGRMMRAIRGDHGARVGTSREEQTMVSRHNRRLIATRDVALGTELRENENFGIYRSLKDDTHAYSPFMIDEVNGKIAKRDIRVGDGIGPGDV